MFLARRVHRASGNAPRLVEVGSSFFERWKLCYQVASFFLHWRGDVDWSERSSLRLRIVIRRTWHLGGRVFGANLRYHFYDLTALLDRSHGQGYLKISTELHTNRSTIRLPCFLSSALILGALMDNDLEHRYHPQAWRLFFFCHQRSALMRISSFLSSRLFFTLKICYQPSSIFSAPHFASTMTTSTRDVSATSRSSPRRPVDSLEVGEWP